jgi:tetratricopeptide (TPR) repeat protein
MTVEMELGLYEEASAKLSRAMNIAADPAVRSLSAYFLGICQLSMAKRDNQDGKAGAAFNHLQRGIESCRDLDRHLGGVLKLIGDLHSFGALVPPDVFAEDADTMSYERSIAQEERMVRLQLAFVAEGKIAYEAAESLIPESLEEETLARACAASDIGSNLLLQAQLVSFWQNKGIDEMATPEAEQILDQAEREFRRSIGIFSQQAPAWCGLGCAVHKFDPVLAQHAFCRSVELDPMFPEPYANLGFLYTRCGATRASNSVSMALTQVEDTPMMWINRALLLERQRVDDKMGSVIRAPLPVFPAAGGSVHRMEHAADAYRAALQISPLPSAKLGLALSGRRVRRAPNGSGGECVNGGTDEASRFESDCLFAEYIDSTGRLDVASCVLGGVAECESGAVGRATDRLNEGRIRILAELARLDGPGEQEDEMDDERDGDLDLESIRALLALHPAEIGTRKPPRSSAGSPAARAPVDRVGLAKRNVHRAPNRGDLWLKLARELVVAIDSVPSTAAGKDDGVVVASAAAIRNARAAAFRARHLLLSQARHPALRSSGPQSPPPSARDASDALALHGWIVGATAPAGLVIVGPSTPSNAPSSGEEGTEGGSGSSMPGKGAANRIPVDVQRALLLCPDNAVAREALTSMAMA